MLPLLFLLQSSGEDSQGIKVMFFGDSVVSGVHNKEVEICPFRYEFLRTANQMAEHVQVVGTNADAEGTCQKIGEELDVHNNGYFNAGIDDLLDYITADLQYLHNPVDYIFTSLGAVDCAHWVEGRDPQILSQSVRRIMGRLLNINENAKIVHIPIMLPETAGNDAVKCMEGVNKVLRDIYNDDNKNARIRIMNLSDKYGSDSFFTVDKDGNSVKIGEPDVAANPVVAQPVVTPNPPAVETQPVVVQVPQAPAQPVAVAVPQTPAQPVVAPQVPAQPVVAPVPTAPAQPVVAPVPTAPAQPVAPETSGTPRRLENAVIFLPNHQLAEEIAKVLIDAVDWGFRAQTLFPTPDATKEPEYYGYDWCLDNYDDAVCFEYYYGYAWCLEEYDDDECYTYYYGEMEEWGKEDNYKWCLNFYDEEYCEFAYHDGQLASSKWLSFGYQDCIKSSPMNECFDLYYGYAWCIGEYQDEDCYEYYYGGDDWVWNEESSYTWCINFYTEDECSERYLTSSAELGIGGDGSGSGLLIVVAIVGIGGTLGWVIWKKYNCFMSKPYSRLDARDEGGEDEVELL